MKKLFRSRVFLIICVLVLVVALIGMFFVDWRNQPGGWIGSLGMVILSVLGGAANLVSIFNDTNNSSKNEIESLPRLPERGKLPLVGDLPAGSRMPYPRNACFCGRERELLNLADALLYAPKVQAVAVTGLGGIGKTQLAAEFCHRYGRYFEGVHWLNCREGGVESQVVECGLAMGLQPWPEKQPEQVGATLRAWEKSRRRLLVLDGLEDPELLRAWLPQFSRCRLLLTTRRVDWPADLGLKIQPLGTFTSQESLDSLRRLTPRLQSVPDVELEKIAEKLGHLPLALDLAGRYLKERESLSPAAYLDELLKQENLLFHGSLLNWAEGSPTGHETSLAMTFKLSWEQLDETDESDALARKIFLLAGWCAPDKAIPHELLLKAVAIKCSTRFQQFLSRLDHRNKPSIISDERFDGAAQRLCTLGLLERLEGELAIQPLLAAFACFLQSKEEKKTNLVDLSKAVSNLAYQASQAGLPKKYRLLFPHLDVLVPMVEKEDQATAAELWCDWGFLLSMVADFPKARDCCEYGLHLSEAVYGSDHRKIARMVNNLGLALKELGDFDEAQACYERALNIDEATYGPNHKNVAIRVNNLGGVLLAKGDLPGARALFERALRIDEAVYGEAHPAVATIVNNLGSVLHDQGDLGGARECFQRALCINEAAYGVDHPAVAVDVNNLGLVLLDQGDLGGARACCERALRIDEAVYGMDHTAVARDLNSLGYVLQHVEELDEARACYERALRIFEKFLSPDHPKIQMVRKNLEALGAAQDSHG